MVHISTETISPPSSQSSDAETASPAQSRMDQTLKAKWCAALRSEKFDQGKGALRCEDQFCCMGVLCEISELGKWEILIFDEEDGPQRSSMFEYIFSQPHARDSELLPNVILDHFGISGEQQERLWKMNDGAKSGVRSTFSEIADYIEANL